MSHDSGLRLTFAHEGSDDDFWSCTSPSAPRVGDHVSLLNTEGDQRLDGDVIEVSWGQSVTQSGTTWIPVPFAPPVVFVTVRGTIEEVKP